MIRTFYMLFAALAYAIFLATFLYLIAFVGNISVVPRTIDSGPESPLAIALVANLALIALFGIQHSVMARKGFKAVWTRIVPEPIERSAYVLLSSAALIALFLWWQALPQTVWAVSNPIGVGLLWGLFALGWGIVLTSTYLINHFELFGLQQAWFALRDRVAATPVLRQPFFYKFVRHPLYSGFFIAFWATPVMSVGHLLLAIGMSAYMLIAIRLEERDLVAVFGSGYVDYQRNVGMLVPGMGKRT